MRAPRVSRVPTPVRWATSLLRPYRVGRPTARQSEQRPGTGRDLRGRHRSIHACRAFKRLLGKAEQFLATRAKTVYAPK